MNTNESSDLIFKRGRRKSTQPLTFTLSPLEAHLSEMCRFGTLDSDTCQIKSESNENPGSPP